MLGTWGGPRIYLIATPKPPNIVETFELGEEGVWSEAEGE